MSFRGMATRASVAALLVLAACGEDSTVTVINQSPTIAFTFEPLGVPAQTTAELTVSVSDPNEEDNLTVSWEITRGSLTPVNAANTAVTWDVPDVIGTDTVTVTVSDGEDRVSVTDTLKVGTAVSTSPGTWRAADSPYILTAQGTPPRLNIGAGITNIEAGVEILIDLPETTIDVTGNLNVMGTAGNPVVIHANNRLLRCGENRGWWEGILVGTDGPNSGTVDLDFLQVEYAVNGVRLRDTGSANIQNSVIRCCADNGILHEGTGSLVVDSCEIRNMASNGVTVSAITLLPALVSITNSDISINENTGLFLDLSDVLNDVPVTIEGNRIEFNLAHGIVMENWVWPEIHYNHISSNGGGGSNIRLQSPFHDATSPDTLDVSCNYWGRPVSSVSSIENGIRDRLDSASLGTRLDVVPWLNEDPYQASTMPPCDGGVE